MAQDLTVNIKTTSDVPQAMEKSKSAVVSFSKQVEDIQKKFSTAFKDIFLGFTAPMVILQSVISSISSAIAQAKADAQAGLDLMAKGNTIYATEEEKKMANFIKAKMAREKEMEEVAGGKRQMTEEFLKTPEGQALLNQRKAAEDELYGGRGGRRTRMSGVGAKSYDDPSDPSFQAAALRAFLNSEAGKAYKPIFDEKEAEKKAGSFKGPEGFGTVVGVGANPVMEKMTRQNEILEEIKIILQEQSLINRGGMVPSPFTEAVPLTLQKMGAV
jgi:hypothetical protein